MALSSPARLQRAGLLDEADVADLRFLCEHHPLRFELVLKRRLRAGGVKLGAGVFEGLALTLGATTVQAV